MGPINYNMPMPDFGATILQGLKLGNAIGDIRQQRQAQEQQALREMEFKKRFEEAFPTRDPERLKMLSAQFPDFAKPYQEVFDSLSQQDQEQEFSLYSRVDNALRAGNPKAGIELLRQREEAMRNSGRIDDADEYAAMAQGLETDPDGTSREIVRGLVMSAPQKYFETFKQRTDAMTAEAKAPADIAKANADASKATTEAQFAATREQMDLALKDEQIRASRESTKLRALEAQLTRLNNAAKTEENDLRRQELGLKVEAARRELDQKASDRLAEGTNAIQASINAVRVADELLKMPGAIKNAAGPISDKLPTFRGNTASAEEALKTLQSQVFLTQVPQLKGLGQLSNAEGAKLDGALASLSLRQGEDQLIRNIKIVRDLTLKAQQNISKKYGIPIETPAAAGPSIDELLKKYGQ